MSRTETALVSHGDETLDRMRSSSTEKRDPVRSIDGIALNIIAVDESVADDFETFCRVNSKACPIISRSEPGAMVWGHSAIRAERSVTFALGSCSVMDVILKQNGIYPRQPWSDEAPRFRTRFKANSVGRYGSDLIVSMRSIHRKHLDSVRSICAKFPFAHGSPVHIGEPADLGIANLSRPDWGLPIQIGPGEVPVFFASSMTAKLAAADSGLPVVVASSSEPRILTSLQARIAKMVAA